MDGAIPERLSKTIGLVRAIQCSGGRTRRMVRGGAG